MSPFVSTRLLLTQSDARLVKLARDGHERAFEALVQRYRRPLLGYCRRLLLPDERAEDALQQGLLQAWLALQDGADVGDVRPWLYRIVHNTALNMLRVSGYDYAKLSDTLQGASAPEDDLDRRIAVRDAFAGLAALPAMQREALLRTAVDGHSHEHVAQALGLSEGALRGLVYRARATLRAATTALTPPPAVSWALTHRGVASAPLTSRLAELGAGSGSIGVGSLLLKGGAVVVTAGALAGGITASHHHGTGTATHLAVDTAQAAAAQATPSSAQTSGAGQAQQDGGKTSSHAHPGPGGNGRRGGLAGHAGRPIVLGGFHTGLAGPGDGRSLGHTGDSGHEGQAKSPSASDGHQGSGSGDGSGGKGSSGGKDSSSFGSGEESKDGKDASSASSGGSDSSSSGDSGSGTSGDGSISPEGSTSSGDGSKSGDSQPGGTFGGLLEPSGSSSGSLEPSPTKDGSAPNPSG